MGQASKKSEDKITPSSRFFPITPADADLADIPKALYIAGAGNLVVRNASGTAVTFTNVPAGSILPISPIRVAAATTCTGIVGLA